MNTREFLKAVITPPPPGDDPDVLPPSWLCLGIKSGGTLRDQWLAWPDLVGLEALLDAAREAGNDVYFIPHLFERQANDKEALLPTRTIAVDLDSADLMVVSAKPTALVSTSPNRLQAYWIIEDNADTEFVETLARNLAYSIPGADRTSWFLLTPFRLPGTTNFKYIEPHEVRVTTDSGRIYKVADLEFVEDPSFVYDESQMAFLQSPPTVMARDRGPQAILEEGRQTRKVSPKVAASYMVKQPNGRQAIWEMLTDVIGNGMSREDAYWLARQSPNNPFATLRFHGDREIAKEVLRAEALVRTRKRDIRELISDARTTIRGAPHERKKQLFDLVVDNMKSEGEFLRVNDSQGFYIRRDRGRPIPINRRNGLFAALLDVQYGLNRSEIECEYIANGLEAYIQQLPVHAIEQALSYYDEPANTLYLHPGKKDVYRITPTTVERVIDGAYGVVFQWPILSDPFTPQLSHTLERPWYEYVFGDALANVVGLTKEQATTILTCWFFFLLFRYKSAARPILAMLGQPGSGKSTMFKRVYALLYGRTRSIGAVTTTADFDQAVSSDPLVVLDNVDSLERWLPDRLAQSSGAIDIVRRKLYEDQTSIILKRHALVGLTAHNPQFTRSDVADRLVIINLERIDVHGKFLPEGQILGKLHTMRNALWGAIVQDVQRILATPPPTRYPQFRIEDFAYMGMWFATALGLEEHFDEGLRALTVNQRTFALEDDNLLISGLTRLLSQTQKYKGTDETELMRAAELFDQVKTYCGEEDAFLRRYHNAARFGRYLVSMQHPLKDIISLEREFSGTAGGWLWRVGAPKKNGTEEH